MKFKSALLFGMLLCSAGAFAADTPPPADDANVKFAREFERHLLNQEADPAAAMFDSGALIDRAQAGISAPKELADGFKEGAGTFNKIEVTNLIGQVAKGGQCVFVRVRQRAGKPVALFRVVMADETFDYLDWYIEPDAKGNLRFVDAYDLAKGELLSQTIRRIYLAAVISDNKGNGAQFGAKETAFVDNLPKMQQMTKAIGADQPQQALDLYHTMPESVQKDKTLMVLRVVAANKLTDPAEYESAIADYEKLFPNDPAIDLLALTHLFSAGQWTAAHQAVDRLIAFTGGDAHLECQHGAIWLAAGKPADLAGAVASYKKAVAEDPQDAEGYWGLVTVYLQQKDFASTAAELTDIEKKLHLTLKDLHSQPLYADFVKSPEYEKWLAAQKAK